MSKFFTIASVMLIAASAPIVASPTADARAPQPSKVMPTELRGNWHEADNYAPPICDNEDQGLLQVRDTGFTFPMEAGELIRIVEHPIDTYNVEIYKHIFTDEPHMPRANVQKQIWTLSHDGAHLNIVTPAMSLDLFRCQPQPSE